jgi:acyl carrier protein
MTKEELRALVAKALAVEVSRIDDAAGPHSIPEWDSVGALGIISVLDRVATGCLTAEDAAGFRSFSAIAEFARRKGIATD